MYLKNRSLFSSPFKHTLTEHDRPTNQSIRELQVGDLECFVAVFETGVLEKGSTSVCADKMGLRESYSGCVLRVDRLEKYQIDIRRMNRT